MTTRETTPTTATGTAKAGCCGPDDTDGRATPPSAHAAHRDHGRPAAPATAAKPADDERPSGRGSGCCCS